MAEIIEIPDFDFTGFYYPEIFRSLIQFKRVNVPEVTDENSNEPFIQLLSAFALVGHLNNVLVDTVATESLLPTSRLLESVRGHLTLIDVRLDQAKPAQTDVVLEFSKIFTVATNIVPTNSQFATEETEADPQIIYENDDDFTIDPTNKPTAIFSFTAGKIVIKDNAFDAGDKVTIETVDFREGIEWAAGGSIALSLQALTDAININVDPNIQGRVFALNDGIDTISVIPLVEGIETIAITETDGATDNFDVLNGGFGLNKVGIMSTPSVFTNMFDDTPKAGDTFYINHQDIMWDTVNFVFDVPGAGIKGVWEFFDNVLDDAKPNSVTNLGSNLEFDLTDLLGTEDRRNTVVRVVLSATGAEERPISLFVGGKNIIRTKGLLGQTVVSTDEQQYVVGSEWNEVSDVSDGTTDLTADGEVEFTIPQSQSQNWVKNTINGFNGHWLRFRIISSVVPTNPSVDLTEINTGKTFLLVPIVQGSTAVEVPLGSSSGGIDQEFILTFKPIIEGTLIIEVNEGSGFQEWNSVENFLNSTSVSKDYTLTISADDTATIKFGDGTRGKIPPAGIDNVRAIYRIGADIDGNVGANTITVNKSGISFVNRIFNPRQANGFAVKEGSTDEDLARLKIEGPATLRTRNRGITTDDIEFLATRFESSAGSQIVSRALSIEETFGVKTIEVIVVGIGGVLLTEAQRTEIDNFFNGNKPLGIKPILLTNHEVTAINYTPRIVNVTATVTGGNAEQIKNAVTSLLNPEATFDDGVTKRWDFGQEIPISVIIAEIFDVDQVNIKKVVITVPAADLVLVTRELPLAGVVTITVV